MRDEADHLDHLVINALFEMDGAAALFASLGFQLTPRGHHSLGSINHLMMLPGCYLELVGLPLDIDKLRQEVLDSPHGPSGFVPGSDDIVATRERLLAVGLHPAGIVDFSRPVMLDGLEHHARFRTVRVATEDFAAGRVYWCQHLTPELVWRDEWLIHDNGLRAIDHLAIDSSDAPAAATRYAKATGGQAARDGDRWVVTLADGFRLLIEPASQDRYTRIGLTFHALHGLADRAAHRHDLQWQADGSDHATLTIPSLALVLDCRAA
ncbi:MAG: VOC family protein [Burkholderiaceae bacterium]